MDKLEELLLNAREKRAFVGSLLPIDKIAPIINPAMNTMGYLSMGYNMLKNLGAPISLDKITYNPDDIINSQTHALLKSPQMSYSPAPTPELAEYEDAASREMDYLLRHT